MSSLRSFIRAFAIAAACAFITAPLVAHAEDKPKAPRVEKAGKHHHDKGDFPMEPTKFSELLERKIEVARAQMELIMTANALPDGVKTQARKDFDTAAAKVRTVAKEAAKDGKVTKDEAKDVRHQARDVVKQMREKYGKDKDKDHDKGRGKHREKADK
jgi:hypothetical protein